mmetsp:Transcript_47160/g.115181  ORF Transcript_47160/g.115181 Transcript_47160/m.115181 type:complete len:92 (-) Transcript_47160:851-1126(-)
MRNTIHTYKKLTDHHKSATGEAEEVKDKEEEDDDDDEVAHATSYAIATATTSTSSSPSCNGCDDGRRCNVQNKHRGRMSCVRRWFERSCLM